LRLTAEHGLAQSLNHLISRGVSICCGWYAGRIEGLNCHCIVWGYE
jgi:hypothetical protein